MSVNRGTGPPWLHVVRADPQIQFFDETLHQMLDPAAELNGIFIITPTVEHEHNNCPVERCFHGAVVRVEADNRTVVYRVSDYDWCRNAWNASWPD